MANENAQTRYHKANIVNLRLGLNRKTDQDVIEKLDSVPNKQGYIKQLIRQDIATSTSKNK